MAILNFSMLEITILSERYSFRDDGFVPDVAQHTMELFRQWGHTEDADKSYELDILKGRPRGRCVGFSNKGKELIVIYYLHSDPITESFIRGHEETHALHAIGRIDLLHQRLLQRGVPLDLLRYSAINACSQEERELVANIGALYVLENGGMDISTMPIKQNDPEFRPAIRLYQKALHNRL